jgi:hypothetical protein
MRSMGDWTFFSNYGHVLVCLARNHDARLRDVAEQVGVTERAVQKIVRDLQVGGFLTVSKQGRCNRYRINKRKALRHELEGHCTVGKLLALVARPARPGQPAEPEDAGDAAYAGAERAASPAAAPAIPGDLPVPAEAAARPEPAPAEKAGKKKPSPADTRQQGSLF